MGPIHEGSPVPRPTRDAAAARMMGPGPSRAEIAVVIGAVGRECFLPAAIDSVLGQTLPRDRYEIVVTKDFRSKSLDATLEELGVRTVFDPDRRMGRVVRAARSTRAPLIAYLDDDDLFEPQRLQEVVQAFRERPGLSFYRNRVSVVDGAGAPIDPQSWDRLYRDGEFDRTGPIEVPAGAKRARWPQLRRTYSEFNLSSMAFRRDLLDGPAGAFLEGVDSRSDISHFLVGYLGDGDAYFDDRRLSRYRLHASNNSRIRVRPGQVLPKGWTALGRLAAVARARGYPEVARWALQQRVTAGLGFHVERLSRTERAEGGAAPTTASAREYLRFLRENPGALTRAWAWKPIGRAARQLVAYRPVPARRRPAIARDHLPVESWEEIGASPSAD